MKLDSKLFDGIRIRSRQTEEPRPAQPSCDWEGCEEAGEFRAPKANRAEGQYHHFCLEHVRHYNATFNFFAGMKPEDIEATVSRARPEASFGMGDKPRPNNPNSTHRARPRGASPRFSDPLNLFARVARNQGKQTPREKARASILEADRRALETLGLDQMAKADEIKQAYKALVKKHHPDANGGDKASEDRLRTIIAAYSHLKAKGFVGR